MTTRIAINGFGRIGEMLLRSITHDSRDLEVVAINDIIDLGQIEYLLRYDSVHQSPPAEIEGADGWLRVDGRRIRIFKEADPAALPWGDLGVDVVVECTGAFTTREGMQKHMEAGARKVLLSAPAKDNGADITVCLGVNHDKLDVTHHDLISNGSCTTNCLAVVLKVIDDAFGWRQGMMSTIHAYTGSQSIVDAAQRRMRRGRAAAVNIVPTTTGAARSTTEVLPHLEGKIDGMAFRVPVPDGSVIDVVFETERPLTADSLHSAFEAAVGDSAYRGVVGITYDEIVSSDIIGSPLSALVDASSTMTLGDRMAKVVAWYDNEWGYACRCRDMAAYIGARMHAAEPELAHT